MAKKTKPNMSYLRIVVGLPNLQDQIRMVKRLAVTAVEPELARWEDLGQLLSELYSQLQQQRQVTVYRFGNKSCSKVRADN
jgi:hypothetical protein